MSGNGAIRIANVSYRYKAHGPLALDRVSLSLAAGERVALLGRTGCGKSTLLHIVAGLLKPSAGQVEIDGAVVTKASPRWNLMFQKPLLLPWLTVAQNAALGLRFTNRMGEAKAKVPALLRLVGLDALADAPVTELSGGQQQRVALVRSLATDPDILLLDEPFAALDPVTRADLRREVLDIATDLGLTLLLVTHDVDEAIAMADRVVILSSGPGRPIADLDVGQEKSSAGSAALRARLLGLLGENQTTYAAGIYVHHSQRDRACASPAMIPGII